MPVPGQNQRQAETAVVDGRIRIQFGIDNEVGSRLVDLTAEETAVLIRDLAAKLEWLKQVRVAINIEPKATHLRIEREGVTVSTHDLAEFANGGIIPFDPGDTLINLHVDPETGSETEVWRQVTR